MKSYSNLESTMRLSVLFGVTIIYIRTLVAPID